MLRLRSNFYLWWLDGCMLLLILSCIACSPLKLINNTQPAAAVSPMITLPGQQAWKNGVSSFLFGTNDTQEWAVHNVQTSPAIQRALKDAHFTLMRTFFFDKSLADNHATSDAEIEQRLKTVEQSGMICLGVLANIFNDTFNKHIVSYAGSRCQLYEFGNEDDYNGVSIDDYLKQWNRVIPALRAINPHARFIGPVTYNDQGNHNFMQQYLEGVKSSGVLPDAVSFHWYPCYNDDRASCLTQADSYYQAVQSVRALIQNTLGKELPIGITEWNYDPGNPPPDYGDDANFITQFTTAALQAMIRAGVSFACQFDAASYSGYGRLDMFDVDMGQPKPQYYAIKALIQKYLPTPPTPSVPKDRSKGAKSVGLSH